MLAESNITLSRLVKYSIHKGANGSLHKMMTTRGEGLSDDTAGGYTASEQYRDWLRNHVDAHTHTRDHGWTPPGGEVHKLLLYPQLHILSHCYNGDSLWSTLNRKHCTGFVWLVKGGQMPYAREMTLLTERWAPEGRFQGHLHCTNLLQWNGSWRVFICLHKFTNMGLICLTWNTFTWNSPSRTPLFYAGRAVKGSVFFLHSAWWKRAHPSSRLNSSGCSFANRWHPISYLATFLHQ